MTEHLIVDAFNLIHAAGRVPGFERFRDVRTTVFALEGYCYQSGKRMTLIFDGTRFEHELSESKAFRVLFSNPGETGDAVAERLMMQIPVPNRLHATVVSDDSALRSMAVGMGVRTRGTAEFLREIAAVSRDKGVDDQRPQRPFNTPFDKL